MIGNFHLLYRSQEKSSYITLYDKETFKKSSNQEDSLQCNVNESPAEMLLDLKRDTVEYIDQTSLELSLNTGFIHQGQDIAYKSSKLYVNADHHASVVNTQSETLRNQAFINFFSCSSLSSDFGFGHIKVRKPKGKGYSVYSSSKNNVCIIHKAHYKDAHCAVAGIFSAVLDDQETSTNEVDECVASAGVIEFKRQSYNTKQTFKEMLKSAGDLVAKVLMEGEIVDHIIMYGLAANYKESSAKLTMLQLDFVNQQVVAIESEEAVKLHQALNWLLNCITLN